MLLNQEVSQLNQNLQLARQQMMGESGGILPSKVTTKTQPGASWFQQFENRFGKNSKYFVYAAVILVLIALLLLISFRGNKQKKSKNNSKPLPGNSDEEVADEYDFMGSEEAIPAKLDLARSYLAMEDYLAASKVLEEIVAKGSSSQQKEAEKLLQKIPSTT